MDGFFAKPEGYISVASMAWRGVVAIAFMCVVMAIVVPLTYTVSDVLTVSKGDAQRRKMKETLDESETSEKRRDKGDGEEDAIENDIASTSRSLGIRATSAPGGDGSTHDE